MDTNKPSNTLAIIGLVLGSIAIVFSFIPCVGTLAFIPGIVGVILGVIAFLKAKDNGHPRGLSITAIAISLVACAISVFQIYAFGNMTSEMKSNLKEYTNCVELVTDFKNVQNEMKVLTQEMEENNASFSNISKIAKLGFKLENIQEQSEKLGCDVDIDDIDLEGEEASEEAGEEPIEGAEEVEEEGK